MVIVVEVIILAVTISFIGYPLFSNQTEDFLLEDPHTNDFQKLLSKKDMVYSAIKELDFDFATGKLSENDYHELKSQYQLEAVNILETMDTFGKGKKSKTKQNKLVCQSCRKQYNRNDKFCPNCGNKL